jgi:TetR/AcrR family transcriptional regulator, cholesterol catabolism regulator
MDLATIERAAVRRFAADGYAATGIREVGREAGLNSATLYHYAATKQDLLAGVMRRCLGELDQIAATAIASAGSSADLPDRQLVRLTAAHVGMSARNPATCRVTDQEIRSLTGTNLRAVLELRDRYEARWDAVLRAGIRSGGFVVPDRALTRLALIDMCNGVANWYHPGGRLSVGSLQLRLAALATRMVGSPLVPTRAEARIAVAVLSCEPDAAPVWPRLGVSA